MSSCRFPAGRHLTSTVKIVVLSPHRDDAAFSLGLSLAQWLDDGHAITVLNCFTQSEYAPYSDVDSLHRNDRASFATAVRRKEDIAWNKLLGGKLRFHDLDLLDAPLRLACSVDEVLHVPIRPGDRAVARVAGAVAKLIRGGTPEATAVLVPLAVGGHIDHRVVRQAALDALSGTDLPVAFYEDLPYAARAGEAEELATVAEATGLLLRPTFASPPADVADAVRRKMRMGECYDSQVDSEVVGSIGEFCLRYSGRERLWANAAWLLSGLAVPVEAKA